MTFVNRILSHQPVLPAGGSMAKEMAAAMRSFQEGDVGSALRTLQAASAQAPTRLPMLVMKACIQASQGQLQDALATIAQVLSTPPSNGRTVPV